MKCPKCGYHSFEYLENCRKCGQDLAEHKAKFNLGGFYPPPAQAKTASPDGVEAPSTSPAQTDSGDDIDFGFEFLDEEEATKSSAQAAEFAPQEDEQDDLDIARPFDIDSETVPSDDSRNQRHKKKDVESDFEF